MQRTMLRVTVEASNPCCHIRRPGFSSTTRLISKRIYHIFWLGGHTYSSVMPSTFSQMPSFVLTGNFRQFACETSVTGIRDAEAIYLSQLIKDWQLAVASVSYDPSKTSISEYKSYDNLRVTAPSRVPAVRVACSGAQNISRDGSEVDFPVLPGYGCWNSTGTTICIKHQVRIGGLRGFSCQKNSSEGLVRGFCLRIPGSMKTLELC